MYVLDVNVSGLPQIWKTEEKRGKNVKKKNFEICSLNFLKLFLFQIIVIIFQILYLTFIVKYVQNLRTLNDFNKIIKICISLLLFDSSFSL